MLYTGRPVRIVRWKGSWSGERNVIGTEAFVAVQCTLLVGWRIS